MTYQTSITKKGQVTIPKEFRDILRLNKNHKVVIELERNKQSVRLRPTPDFFEVIKKIKRPKHPTNVLKAREFMERNYERA